jgi:hypothetical protein
VTILRFVAAQDVGCAIHPSYVEGQIQGGVAQGIGWALNEEYIYDRNGRLDNAGFLDYRVPVASDMPMIEPILVEVPNPAHPYGAKGVGEVNIVPPMAAIANAIDSAIHRRLTELPMSPPKIRSSDRIEIFDDLFEYDAHTSLPLGGRLPARCEHCGEVPGELPRAGSRADSRGNVLLLEQFLLFFDFVRRGREAIGELCAIPHDRILQRTEQVCGGVFAGRGGLQPQPWNIGHIYHQPGPQGFAVRQARIGFQQRRLDQLAGIRGQFGVEPVGQRADIGLALDGDQRHSSTSCLRYGHSAHPKALAVTRH